MVGFGGGAAYCNAYDPGSNTFVGVVGKAGFFSSNVGYNDINLNPIYMADLDGDGKKDMVAFANNGLFTHKSLGSDFAART